MFKVGDIVKCIRNNRTRYHFQIHIGGVYEVIGIGKINPSLVQCPPSLPTIYIRNDLNYQVDYLEDDFEYDLKRMRKKKLEKLGIYKKNSYF